ncbi:MAG: hypothetical protein D6754_13560, partial [Alphaproteobacteria bacterium]
MGAYRLSDIWSAFRRRFWLLVLSVGLISPLALALAYFLPPKYDASAQILVEAPSTTLLNTTLTVPPAQRLAEIEHKLMARKAVLELIDKFGLYADRPDLSTSEKVDLVRRNTRFEAIPPPNASPRSGAVLSFSVSFTSDKPYLTAEVANELVERIMAENLRARTEQAEGTLSFLEKEAARLSRALAEVEAEITTFKNEHEKALPNSLPFRRQEVSNVKNRMFNRDQSRLALAEQLRNLREALQSGQIGLMTGQMTQAERDLQTLRNQLLQSQATLADSHPTIIALKKRIEVLDRVVAQQNNSATAQASRARQQAEQQIALLEKQIALSDRQQQADAAYLKDLEESIALTPKLEIELNRMLRRQAQLQAEYDAVIAKRNVASTDRQLEAGRKSERFVLIESARPPEGPTSPNRPLIAAGGVFFS